MNQVQDAYRFIRNTDRANLEAVLKTFERNGVSVSLGGSAAVRDDYDDIDLRVSNLRMSEDNTVDSHSGLQTGLHRALIELEQKYGARIRDCKHRQILYLNLYVNERYTVVMGDTRFDVIKGYPSLEEIYGNAQLGKFFLQNIIQEKNPTQQKEEKKRNDSNLK